MSVKSRDKLLIVLSVLACGVSIAVFALVSLGHFIYSPTKPTLPVVAKVYQSTVQQVALLEPVAVPQTSSSSSSNTPPPVSAPLPAQTEIVSPSTVHDQKNLKQPRNGKSGQNKQQNYADLRKTLGVLFKLLEG